MKISINGGPEVTLTVPSRYLGRRNLTMAYERGFHAGADPRVENVLMRTASSLERAFAEGFDDARRQRREARP